MRKLTEQDAERPAINRDVVDADQQHMVLWRQAEQPRPQQRPKVQAERRLRRLASKPRSLGQRVGAARNIGDRQVQRGRRVDDRHRPAIRTGDETGPQRLMPRRQLGECSAQGRRVELPLQPQRGRNVVA